MMSSVVEVFGKVISVQSLSVNNDVCFQQQVISRSTVNTVNTVNRIWNQLNINIIFLIGYELLLYSIYSPSL